MAQTTQATEPRWRVLYRYDGGSGCVVVYAPDRESAIAAGMAKAKALYASDPLTPCTLTSAYRIMLYSEMQALPNRGIERAIDLTWDRRDGGHRYLVIERGHSMHGHYDCWTTTGRIIGSADTARGAARIAEAARRRMFKIHRQSPQYDVVERDTIAISMESGAYGLNSGDITA